MIFIWLILLFLTGVSFFLGDATLVGLSFIIGLFLITFIKAQLVIDYFMGLKNVSLKYRLFPTLWLFIVVLLICIAYLYPIN